MNSFQKVAKYLSEGFARIFAPANDSYPKTGVQPYEGDTRHKKDTSDW